MQPSADVDKFVTALKSYYGIGAMKTVGALHGMPLSKRAANAVGRHFGKLGDNMWCFKSRLFRKVE